MDRQIGEAMNESSRECVSGVLGVAEDKCMGESSGLGLLLIGLW